MRDGVVATMERDDAAVRCASCGRLLSAAEVRVDVDYCSLECAQAVPGSYLG